MFMTRRTYPAICSLCDLKYGSYIILLSCVSHLNFEVLGARNAVTLHIFRSSSRALCLRLLGVSTIKNNTYFVLIQSFHVP